MLRVKMPGIQCTAPECEYTTVKGTVGEMHTQVAHGRADPGPHCKGPALMRPKVEAGTSEEVWQVFEQKWKLFKTGVGLETRQTCPQLFDCCEGSLQDNLLKEGAKVEDLGEKELLMSIKRLAVVPVAISIRRAELLGMAQDVSENTRSFYARVNGKADTCNYLMKCTCDQVVEFTATVVKDVFMSGLSDEEIKHKVLGWMELDESSVANNLKFVEGKEMARDAMAGSRQSVAAEVYIYFETQFLY